MNQFNLFLDIETHPDLTPGAVDSYIAAVEPPAQYKKPESIAEWKAANADKAGREQWSRSALDPMRGGIYVIGWKLGDGDVQTMYRNPVESEVVFLEGALQNMASALTFPGRPINPRFIGWNHIAFDIPFLAKRCVILGVTPPFRLPTSNRYNGERVLDLMQAWGGRDWVKQSVVAAALGITDGPEVSGGELWGLVEREGVQVAARKCAADVAQLAEIHRRMEGVFTF